MKQNDAQWKRGRSYLLRLLRRGFWTEEIERSRFRHSHMLSTRDFSDVYGSSYILYHAVYLNVHACFHLYYLEQKVGFQGYLSSFCTPNLTFFSLHDSSNTSYWQLMRSCIALERSLISRQYMFVMPPCRHSNTRSFFFFPARRNVHVPCSDCLFCIKNIAKDFLIPFLRHALTSNSGLKLYSRALTLFCAP